MGCTTVSDARTKKDVRENAGLLFIKELRPDELMGFKDSSEFAVLSNLNSELLTSRKMKVRYFLNHIDT